MQPIQRSNFQENASATSGSKGTLIATSLAASVGLLTLCYIKSLSKKNSSPKSPKADKPATSAVPKFTSLTPLQLLFLPSIKHLHNPSPVIPFLMRESTTASHTSPQTEKDSQGSLKFLQEYSDLILSSYRRKLTSVQKKVDCEVKWKSIFLKYTSPLDEFEGRILHITNILLEVEEENDLALLAQQTKKLGIESLQTMIESEHTFILKLQTYVCKELYEATAKAREELGKEVDMLVKDMSLSEEEQRSFQKLRVAAFSEMEKINKQTEKETRRLIADFKKAFLEKEKEWQEILLEKCAALDALSKAES